MKPFWSSYAAQVPERLENSIYKLWSSYYRITLETLHILHLHARRRTIRFTKSTLLSSGSLWPIIITFKTIWVKQQPWCQGIPYTAYYEELLPATSAYFVAHCLTFACTIFGTAQVSCLLDLQSPPQLMRTTCEVHYLTAGCLGHFRNLLNKLRHLLFLQLQHEPVTTMCKHDYSWKGIRTSTCTLI